MIPAVDPDLSDRLMPGQPRLQHWNWPPMQPVPTPQPPPLSQIVIDASVMNHIYAIVDDYIARKYTGEIGSDAAPAPPSGLYLVGVGGQTEDARDDERRRWEDEGGQP